MNLLLLGLFALALWLMFSLYRSHNRKKAELLLPVRSASIVKIHSYKSFGIIATIRFKEELTPQIGDRLHEEGNIYQITGVVTPDPVPEQPKDTWDCRLVKI
ncbi:hypothetical protein SAMN05660461_0411 [Chitinophaga ginsengisegetis]|uniref:Uncharacterized protein n=1 Tax=Chitinophaga ginsengisegetis TaxID=393003 RepID=A0A1T5N4Y9_9BACT|nr:hypothetical protein [Chitinophaga ginsengisegetis]MDR6571194.1 hypothetical protein [Chitinophaga ginsengisegetis]MDR6650968.1 hypothetical protein [Chitinophaga ginsengisegetis]MDR6657278.1 hypothetical protein [Chitinophaga ginsengisegetis]SKC95517.1 hypothetical protein SAMN05660461_0411 [Chitinophaga ginsengisegetis]